MPKPLRAAFFDLAHTVVARFHPPARPAFVSWMIQQTLAGTDRER
ncbi:MAG: hypothetical protein ACRDZ4_10130 [Egibacteraceae bacterium]